MKPEAKKAYKWSLVALWIICLCAGLYLVKTTFYSKIKICNSYTFDTCPSDCRPVCVPIATGSDLYLTDCGSNSFCGMK